MTTQRHTAEGFLSTNDLDPRDPRTPILLVGVGGTGKVAIVELVKAMKLHDIKCGEVHPRSNKVIDIVFVDGNKGEIEESVDNPDATLLREAGVSCVHLYLPNQDQRLKRSQMQKKHLTSNFPSSGDPFGCKADRRDGMVRYMFVRGDMSKRDGNVDRNPLAAISEKVNAWKDVKRELILSDEIRLIVLGGLHGGTGPAASAISADTVNLIKRAYPGKQIFSELHGMLGESAEIDTAMQDGNQDKRTFTGLVSAMYLNMATIQGGVELPDGDFIEELPAQTMILLGGEGPDKRVSQENGHYQPAAQDAEGILAKILGRNVDGFRSNIAINIPIADRDAELTDLSRFMVQGNCKLLEDPTHEVLEARKRRDLFNRAVKLGNVVDADFVEEQSTTIPFNEFVGRIRRTIEIGPINISQLEPNVARDNVFRVVEKFRQNIDEYESEARLAVSEPADQLVETVQNLLTNIRNDQGVTLAAGIANDIMVKLRTLIDRLPEEIDEDAGRVEKLEKDLDAHRDNVKNMWKPVPIPFLKARQEQTIRDQVDRIQDVSKILADLRVKLAVNERYQEKLTEAKGLLDQIQSLCARAVETEREARHVLESIQPVGETFETPFDLKIDVELRYDERPEEVRAILGKGHGDWTLDQMQAAAHSVRLEVDDTNLMEQARNNPSILKAMVSRSKPPYRISAPGHVTDTRIVRQVLVPLPPAEYELDATGALKDHSGVSFPSGFSAFPTAQEGRLLMTQEDHNLSLLDIYHTRNALERLLKVPAIKRNEFFTRKGDMAKMLPPFARALAELKFEEHGKEGEIYETEETVDGFTYSIARYRTAQDAARINKLRVAQGNEAKEVLEGGEGKKKAGEK